MTHAHGAHGDKHDHPETMTKSPAGEPVQLGPDGTFSKWPMIRQIAGMIICAAVTVWLVVRTFAVMAMPLDKNGHATDAISDNAVPAFWVGAGLMALAVVMIGVLIGGSGRTFRSWMMTLVFVALWVAVIVVALLCLFEVTPLMQAWKTP